jgi:hypothetical protein
MSISGSLLMTRRCFFATAGLNAAAVSAAGAAASMVELALTHLPETRPAEDGPRDGFATSRSFVNKKCHSFFFC